ncbi:MAG: asparagine synthase (glutamine-hydrolyzing) [candidate division KSB1 bacterium]|nr:asparagine synthase (glutamine-hydrolyzing) [candidate division KSB1 bacterium]MDZ7276005.1 asparagine synthase (glutamine-hydrolyzing) [candidate division KSB1 bacterium]MDZ7285713.1 asparagine synthase (glutamine-hydrolyzing) [candidate division KSB1 bacterium]MDZ7298745.1 asparagine synthase (glutamine-hydrolyzing) [candidate division KSB1 bacterium]MDZ7305928.1 asparagine synthase (glutamine-hydrolyzing) [candidate division KSB1 bacterium]
MCGICGIMTFSPSQTVVPEELRRMNDALFHRGPDEEGFYYSDQIGMAMRRLSIIDLSSGQQPISNEDGTLWIVYNGEVYNYLALRAELERRGHRFKTKSDTEAILHAYEEYGVDCPGKLNGMFGFAIWDTRQRSLFLARDRMGKKPLYYYAGRDRFLFASEMKSLLQAQGVPRRISPEALDLYLTYEYVPAPHTILADLKKLPAGHSLLIKADGKIELRRYWDLHFRENGYHAAELQQGLVELLQDAVKIRLMSEVPLGAFLSGGIDSSCVVALMARAMNQPVKTFSIGFEEGSYNELEYARAIARHYRTDHKEFILRPNALELTEKLVRHLDEPLGDFSIFPTYLVAKMAREHVTVVLSGDGGDELFAGYDAYRADRLYHAYRRLPAFVRHGLVAPVVKRLPPTEKKKGALNKIKRFVEGTQHPEDLQHVRWMIFLAAQEKRLLYGEALREVDVPHGAYDFMRHHFQNADSQDALNRQLYVDLKTYLCDDIMVKVDRMSMAVSLEARAPFLDYRVVEYAATIPSALKLRGKQSKWILKQAMADLLPPQILKRGKEGFSIPIKNWLKQELRPLMLDVLSPARLKREGFFDAAYVQRLIDEHLRGSENHSHRLWALTVFGIWHDHYLS